MTLHLRPARSTDAGAVGAILSAFIDTTAWMPRIHTRAQDLQHAGSLIERGWVTVAETDGAICAFAAREEQTVQALYVDEKAQRQGFGTALLNGLKHTAPKLSLWTFQANLGAQKFYTSHGFVEVARTDGSGNDEGLPDIQMEWQKETT